MRALAVIANDLHPAYDAKPNVPKIGGSKEAWLILVDGGARLLVGIGFPAATVARKSFFCPNRNKRLDNISADSAMTKHGGAAQMSPNRSGVYYPEELSLLGHVLNQAVESLPIAMRTPDNRAEIARNILDCAATGERDPIELVSAALTSLITTAT